MNNHLLPPLKRIGVACVVLAAGWVLFMQIAPRLMTAPPPPPTAMLPAPAPSVITPTPAPTPPPMVQEAPPLADISLQAKLAEQDKTIAELKAQQERLLARWEAYDALKSRVLSGLSYADELQRLQKLAAGDAPLESALAALQPAATTGIPTLEMLTRRFAFAEKAALHPPLPPDATLTERIASNAGKFIYIRRVGNVPGDAPEAVIARAEMALDRQDVTAAIAELGALTDAAAQAMQPWLAQAKNYVARDTQLTTIRGALCCD